MVEKVGWECGYGKYVRIRHANGYETAYGHMTAFARSTQPGARVRQGQVIGYVGSTGLSTGPHLHYEILVNGRFVDPLRVQLPRGRVLDGAAARGLRQGAQSRDIVTRINPRVAQTRACAADRGRPGGPLRYVRQAVLLRGDRVAQRERRSDPMQMLDAVVRPVLALAAGAPPMPMTCTVP